MEDGLIKSYNWTIVGLRIISLARLTAMINWLMITVFFDGFHFLRVWSCNDQIRNKYLYKQTIVLEQAAYTYLGSASYILIVIIISSSSHQTYRITHNRDVWRELYTYTYLECNDLVLYSINDRIQKYFEGLFDNKNIAEKKSHNTSQMFFFSNFFIK